MSSVSGAVALLAVSVDLGSGTADCVFEYYKITKDNGGGIHDSMSLAIGDIE